MEQQEHELVSWWVKTDHPTVSAIPTRLTPTLFTAEYKVRRSTRSDLKESSLENRISIGKPVRLDRLDLTNSITSIAMHPKKAVSYLLHIIAAQEAIAVEKPGERGAYLYL